MLRNTFFLSQYDSTNHIENAKNIARSLFDEKNIIYLRALLQGTNVEAEKLTDTHEFLIKDNDELLEVLQTLKNLNYLNLKRFDTVFQMVTHVSAIEKLFRFLKNEGLQNILTEEVIDLILNTPRKQNNRASPMADAVLDAENMDDLYVLWQGTNIEAEKVTDAQEFFIKNNNEMLEVLRTLKNLNYLNLKRFDTVFQIVKHVSAIEKLFRFLRTEGFQNILTEEVVDFVLNNPREQNNSALPMVNAVLDEENIDDLYTLLRGTDINAEIVINEHKGLIKDNDDLLEVLRTLKNLNYLNLKRFDTVFQKVEHVSVIEKLFRFLKNEGFKNTLTEEVVDFVLSHPTSVKSLLKILNKEHDHNNLTPNRTQKIICGAFRHPKHIHEISTLFFKRYGGSRKEGEQYLHQLDQKYIQEKVAHFLPAVWNTNLCMDNVVQVLEYQCCSTYSPNRSRREIYEIVHNVSTAYGSRKRRRHEGECNQKEVKRPNLKL